MLYIFTAKYYYVTIPTGRLIWLFRPSNVGIQLVVIWLEKYDIRLTSTMSDPR